MSLLYYNRFFRIFKDIYASNLPRLQKNFKNSNHRRKFLVISQLHRVPKVKDKNNFSRRRNFYYQPIHPWEFNDAANCEPFAELVYTMMFRSPDSNEHWNEDRRRTRIRKKNFITIVVIRFSRHRLTKSPWISSIT